MTPRHSAGMRRFSVDNEAGVPFDEEVDKLGQKDIQLHFLVALKHEPVRIIVTGREAVMILIADNFRDLRVMIQTHADLWI